MFFTISAYKFCRECVKGTKNVGTINIQFMNNDFYDFIDKTEYEIVLFLEQWIKEKQVKCFICGSYNIEPFDISIEDYPIFNEKKIEERCSKTKENFMYFSLFKDDSQYYPNYYQNGKPEINFLQIATLKLIDIINKRPDSNYISTNIGYFYVFFSGNFGFNNRESQIKIERFSTFGISKEDILSYLKPYIDKFSLSQ